MGDNVRIAMTQQIEDHGGRISRLETSMATLAETTTNLQKSLDGLAGKVDAGFAEQAKFQQTAGRWNVGQLASVIGVTVILIGAFGSPYIASLSETRTNVKELIDDSQKVAETRWSADDAQRNIDRVDKDFDDMRDYVDLRDERVLSISQQATDDLAEELKIQRLQIAVHDKEVSAVNATQNEKLSSLSSVLDRINALEIELARRTSSIQVIEDTYLKVPGKP